MSLHIVFVEPEIPGNTGNIARTCAATNVVLHLIEPLGFDIDEKSVRRAGLDYWEHLEKEVHSSLDEFLEKYKEHRKFFVTTKANHLYTDFEYKDGDMFLFGKETKGLPKWLIAENEKTSIRIPMSEDTRLRSLNLSNCGNIVIFEALRQLNFQGLE